MRYPWKPRFLSFSFLCFFLSVLVCVFLILNLFIFSFFDFLFVFFLSLSFLLLAFFSSLIQNFSFGQIKSNAEDGRSRHRPTKIFKFVESILRT